VNVAYLSNTEVEMMASCNNKEKIAKELKVVDLNVHAPVHPSVKKRHSLFSHPRNNRSLSTYAQFRLPLCYIVYTSTMMHNLHL
jgi:hypothetical protein